MALAAAVTMPALWRLGWRRLWPLGLTAIGAGLLVSMAFFSSFGRHPWGIIDSFSTYFHYLGRASGEGSAGRHVGPWWYYFANLFWWQWDGRVLVTELVVGVFALLGAVAAFSGWGVAAAHRPAARFVAVYTLSLLAVYCVLPYKTPWCALGFLHGLILLGGVGAATLLGIVPRWWSKIALVLSAAAFLGWISYRGSFIYQEDPRNPYVYAHTTSDVIPLCQRVRELALSRPEGRDLPVQVIAPDDDYWPLPWYLRDLSAVGYLSEVPRAPLAPIVVLPPDLEPQMLARNYSAPKGQRHLYVPVDPAPGAPDWRLRPRVPLRVYVRHDLFR
jgi:predicted membrane-bound mannosyltransferase